MSRLVDAVPVYLGAARRRSLFAGAALLAIGCLGGALFGADQFFRSYLVAYLFVLGLAVGALGVAMMHQLTVGEWGLAIERPLEASARTLGWLAVAFVPLAFHLRSLYQWLSPAIVAADDTLRHKALYLNLGFFLGRTAIYLIAWAVLAYFLARWSRGQDLTADRRFTARMKSLSAGGLMVFGFTVTFASIDWIMSLEPRWYSTVYGGMVGVGWMLAAFAFTIGVATLLADRPPLVLVMSEKVRIDLGNMLMTFVILWAYLEFAQLLITWSGNEPEEVVWYVRRLRGGWQGIGMFLAVFQFLIPLLVLLFRAAKRRTSVMLALTGLLVFAHWVNTIWLVVPAFHPGGFGLHWLDVVMSVAAGALWFGAVLWYLEDRPLVPLHHPALPEPGYARQ